MGNLWGVLEKSIRHISFEHHPNYHHLGLMSEMHTLRRVIDEPAPPHRAPSPLSRRAASSVGILAAIGYLPEYNAHADGEANRSLRTPTTRGSY
jgi:hypothetical protein